MLEDLLLATQLVAPCGLSMYMHCAKFISLQQCRMLHHSVVVRCPWHHHGMKHCC
jgi:hypothetical protein